MTQNNNLMLCGGVLTLGLLYLGTTIKTVEKKQKTLKKKIKTVAGKNQYNSVLAYALAKYMIEKVETPFLEWLQEPRQATLTAYTNNVENVECVDYVNEIYSIVGNPEIFNAQGR